MRADPSLQFAVILGTNEIASAVAVRLHRAGFRMVLSHDPLPPVIRRKMAFHDALFDDAVAVEGIAARRADTGARNPHQPRADIRRHHHRTRTARSDRDSGHRCSGRCEDAEIPRDTRFAPARPAGDRARSGLCLRRQLRPRDRNPAGQGRADHPAKVARTSPTESRAGSAGMPANASCARNAPAGGIPRSRSAPAFSRISSSVIWAMSRCARRSTGYCAGSSAMGPRCRPEPSCLRSIPADAARNGPEPTIADG